MNKKANNFLIIFLYLFVLQSTLEISYLDELYAILGVGISLMKFLNTKRISIKRPMLVDICCLLGFILIGGLANIIYKYQNSYAVIIDLFTNIKFYLSIYTTMVLLKEERYNTDTKIISKHARGIVMMLFFMYVLNLFVPIFSSGDYRYGIESSILIFSHPTYMAGAMVFLLAILTIFYEKKNNIFVCMALVLLASTLRGKAVAGAAIYCVIFVFVFIFRGKIKWWHILLAGGFAVILAWEQIYFYYIQLSGKAARSIMTQTAFQIAKDYFPIGTGFGTYASNMAKEFYSPVYVNYGFEKIDELKSSNPGAFLNDTFWPIIIGQTGVIGTILYVILLARIFMKTLKVNIINKYAYAAVLFVFAYLLICSTSEPAFNNSIAIPLAIIIGYALKMIDKKERNGIINEY